MGKYMRKAKISGEVAVMELAQSSLGVRTRAKTLALQRLQTPPPPPTSAPTTTPTPTPNSATSYLQLRSRRLAKSPLVQSSSNDSKTPKNCCNQKTPNPNPNPNPRLKSRLAAVSSVNSGSVGSVSKRDDGGLSKDKEGDAQSFNDLGFEASFGENVLEAEPRERTTRETTPCSLIRGSETIGTPGSTTRPTNSSATNRRIQNTIRRNIPTSHEMEEFFAGAEQQQQRIFTEKYNFDPLTDSPLPGRYEWERVQP